METAAKIRRWRLILGAESQERFSTMGDCALLPQEDLMDQTRSIPGVVSVRQL